MQNILAIQALRALAALSVAAVHFEQTALWLAGDHASELSLFSLSAGVDLFFAISGFVMVYSSADLLGRADAPYRFIARRLARIVAPYWLTTFIAIPMLALAVTPESFVKSLLFIPYPNAAGQFVPLLGVGWTLNFEMFFYLLFALALLASPRLVTPIACVAIVAVVASRMLPGLPTPVWWPFLSDPILLEFVFGMALAVLYQRGVRLPVCLRIVLVAGGAIAIWFHAGSMPPSGARFAVWGMPAAAILAGAVLGQPLNAGAATWPIRTLGDASYAIYLLHPICAGAVLQAWIGFPPIHRLGIGLTIVTAFLTTIILSAIVYRWLERPLSDAIRRVLLGRPRKAAPAPAPLN